LHRCKRQARPRVLSAQLTGHNADAPDAAQTQITLSLIAGLAPAAWAQAARSPAELESPGGCIASRRRRLVCGAGPTLPEPPPDGREQKPHENS
jgi:hypothetical protein